MNIIKITIKELMEMMNIPENKEEYLDAWVHIVLNGFLWDEFNLKINELSQSYKVKIEGRREEQKIKINKIQYDDYGLVLKNYKYEIDVQEYIDKLMNFIRSTKNKEDFKKIYKEQYNFVDIEPPMSFINYIIRESKKRKYEYIETEHRNNESKNRKKTTNNSKNKKYELLDCIKIYQKKIGERKKYEITCESWQVRGYFRHLKSGKVIWVKPFTKGKNKDNKNKKEYKLRSKENENI